MKAMSRLDAVARFNTLAGRVGLTTDDAAAGVTVVATVRAGQGYAICCPACAAAMRLSDPGEVVEVHAGVDAYAAVVCDACGVPSSTWPRVWNGDGLAMVQRAFIGEGLTAGVSGVRVVCDDVAVLTVFPAEVETERAVKAARSAGGVFAVWPVAAGWAVAERGGATLIADDVQEAARFLARRMRSYGDAVAWTDAAGMTTHAPICETCHAEKLARMIADGRDGEGGSFVPYDCPDRFGGDVACDWCRATIAEHACSGCAARLENNAYILQDDGAYHGGAIAALCPVCADSSGSDWIAPGTVRGITRRMLIESDALPADYNPRWRWHIGRIPNREYTPLNDRHLSPEDALWRLIVGPDSW